MQNYASKVSEGMALQLGCLELRYVPPPVPALSAAAGGLGRTRELGLGAVEGFAGGEGVSRSVFAVVGGRGRGTRGQGGCLMSLPSRRRFYKDMPQNALDKKSNFEFLE